MKKGALRTVGVTPWVSPTISWQTKASANSTSIDAIHEWDIVTSRCAFLSRTSLLDGQYVRSKVATSTVMTSWNRKSSEGTVVSDIPSGTSKAVLITSTSNVVVSMSCPCSTITLGLWLPFTAAPLPDTMDVANATNATSYVFAETLRETLEVSISQP